MSVADDDSSESSSHSPCGLTSASPSRVASRELGALGTRYARVLACGDALRDGARCVRARALGCRRRLARFRAQRGDALAQLKQMQDPEGFASAHANHSASHAAKVAALERDAANAAAELDVERGMMNAAAEPDVVRDAAAAAAAEIGEA